MHLAKAISLLLLLSCSHLVFAKTNHKFFDEPQWANPKQPNLDQTVPIDQVKGGRHYLLVDNQIEVSKTGKVATYNHYAEYIVNQNGIENSSQLSIDFDPAYQNLFIHKLHVWRKGKKIDKRSTARITLIQPERDARDLIYNGEQSLNIILDDIRVGDTIEYSYSRNGRNPVYAGNFDTVQRIQWNVPVGIIYQRIIWHKTKPLYFKKKNTEIEVKQAHNGSVTEYIIETKNVPAISLDDATPSWFSPYATVYFSETQNWQDVVKWGSELFSDSTKSSPSIHELATKIKNDNSDKQHQIAVALQYVQANVRYLGLELGENSHRPTRPDVTLQRRYGDCKDKSALYIALLRELDIKAYPALVNTYLQREMQNRLPAYGAFDHVIVKVIYNDKHYWFDPTRQYQLGTAYDIYQPDYGYALVLESGRDSLESMQQPKRISNIVINEQFYVDIKQRDKVRYEVNTTYYGLDSEYQRDRIASNGMQKIQKSYLDFYKYYYPGIKSTEAVKFSDKSGNGILIGTEKYTIADFWEHDQKNNKFLANFYTSSISSYLKEPTQKSRDDPYNLSYPISIEQNITVNFSRDDWAFKKDSFSEDNNFFHFKSDIFYDKKNRQLHLNYIFRTKTHTVPALRYKEYIAALKRAYDAIGYRIEYRAGETSLNGTEQGVEIWATKNGWIIAIAIYVLLIMLGIVLWMLADKKHPAGRGTIYYPVSVPKFLFMWVMTLGMYAVYWFYKNYVYIKRRDGSSIMPIARGIFNIFWYYPIYKDLTLHKANNSVKATIPPRYVGVVLAILFLVTSMLSSWERYALVFFLLAMLSMLPMVNYIYHINDKNSADSRYNSRLAYRHVVQVFIYLPLLLIFVGSGTGLTASDSVVVGDRLYSHDLKFMQRNGIIKPGDKIAYFYSDAFLLIRNDGNGFTSRHVFSYWKEDGELQVETASFDEIKEINITWAKSFHDNTAINIVRKDGTEFLLFVARTKGKDKEFWREINRQWQQVEVFGTIPMQTLTSPESQIYRKLELQEREVIADLFNQGLEAENRKDLHAAIEIYNRVLGVLPDSFSTYRRRGIVKARLKNYSAAIDDYAMSLRFNPNDSITYYYRGISHERLKEYANAIESYDKAIEIKPDNADAYYRRGSANLKRNKYDLAIADYSKTISLNPEYVNAYLRRAVVFTKIAKYELALSDLDKAASIKPDDERVFLERGNVYLRMARLERAVENYNISIKMSPRFIPAYNNRGSTFEKQRKYDLAIADYRKIIEIKPEHPTAYNNLAWLLATAVDKKYQNAQEAVLYAKKSCEITEWKELKYLDTLAAAYARNGDFDEAVHWQHKVVKEGVFPSNNKKEQAILRLKLYQDKKPYEDNQVN